MKKVEKFEEDDEESSAVMSISHIKPMKWRMNDPCFLLDSEMEFRRNTPSRQMGMSYNEEMKHRQMASTLIHNMSGQLSL